MSKRNWDSVVLGSGLVAFLGVGILVVTVNAPAPLVLLSFVAMPVAWYVTSRVLPAPKPSQGQRGFVPSRPSIPRDVKRAVWARDGGRCVQCGSTQNLEFDHIIPYSKGGADSVNNLQILCRACNRSKGSQI